MKKKIAVILFILAIAGATAYFVWGGQEKKEEYITARAQKKDLVQTVSETGSVKAPHRISLSFPTNGKLVKKKVEEGDQVKKGDIIAELDHNSLDKKKKKAEADLEVAQANLQKVLAGAKQETIRVSQSQVQQAKENYEAAKRELESTKETVKEDIQQARDNLHELTSNKKSNITSYEEAVNKAKQNLANVGKQQQNNINNTEASVLLGMKTKLPVANTALDHVHSVLEGEDIESVFSVQNSQYERDTEDHYEDALNFKQEASGSLQKVEKECSREKIKKALEKNIAYLQKVDDTLDYCYKALENTITSSRLPQASLDAYKQDIDAQMTAVNTALSALQSSKNSLESAYLSYDTGMSAARDQLEQAKVNLDEAIRNARDALSSTKVQGKQKITVAENKVNNTKKAWQVAEKKSEEVSSGSTNEEIRVARAKIDQAEASMDLVEERRKDCIMRSPVNGRVVGFKYEIGEQIQAGQPVVSALGKNDYEVKVDISEADIAKVEEGDTAEITLDAFGEEEEFKAKVFFIDPDQTVIQDVVYYEVKLKFIEANNKRLKQMKPGMTANVSITTNKKEDTLVVPGRAVIEKENDQGEMKQYVKILKSNGTVEEKRAQTGLRGDGGMVEVISGVEAGEEVITYVKK